MSDVQQLNDVTLRSISVSSMENNVYLLTHRSGAQVLIDAADDAPAIASLREEATADADAGPELRWIITTHQHWDHVRALAEVKAATGAPTACGRDDAAGIDVPMDRLLDDGDTVDAGAFSLDVIHLVGHTPGSVALALTLPGQAVQLFTGDSLFPGGVGKTGSPQDFTSLLHDVETKLFARYADDTVVHPGHGSPTTLGAERPHLDEWRERGW